MTAAQATIRRLYEQVRVLEAEAARPSKRRTRLPYIGVLVAAVAIGAVSAGVSRSHVAVAVGPPAVRAAAPVAHLIDPPAERARALGAAPPRRRVVRPRAAAPAPARIVLTQHEVAAAPVAPVAPQLAPAPPAAPAPAPAPAHTVHATPAAHPAHAAAPAPVPAKANAKHAPARPAKSVLAPVGIGSVVVSTSDEPLPDDAGATTSTTTTP